MNPNQSEDQINNNDGDCRGFANELNERSLGTVLIESRSHFCEVDAFSGCDPGDGLFQR